MSIINIYKILAQDLEIKNIKDINSNRTYKYCSKNSERYGDIGNIMVQGLMNYIDAKNILKPTHKKSLINK